MEEMAWGDAGIGLAIFGSTLAVAGIIANGTPEQQAEWIPQCFGTPDDIKIAAFGVSEPDAGSDVVLALDPCRLRRGHRRVGAERRQDLDHQRRAGQPPRAGGFGRPGAGEPGPGQLRRPRGHAGDCARVRSSRRWASGRRTPPRSSSTTVACPGRCLLGGKEKLDERLARAREGTPHVDPGRHGHLRGVPAPGRRPGGRHRPGRVRVLPRRTPRSAGSSDGPSSRTRPSPSSWPT